jgi:hypothetical protein
MNVGSASSLVTKVDTVPEDQRVAAAHRIAHRRQRAFKIYAGVLAAVNALIVAFWVVLAIIGRLDLVHISVWPGQPPLPDWFFWPVIPIAICSYLVFMSARRAYPRDGYSDEVLMQEIARHPATRVALGEHEAASAPGNTPRPAPRDLNRAQVPRAAGVESTLAVRRRGFAVHVVVRRDQRCSGSGLGTGRRRILLAGVPNERVGRRSPRQRLPGLPSTPLGIVARRGVGSRR